MTDELTVYKKWDDIPDGIATKTALYRDFGLKLAKGQKPVARKMRFDTYKRHVGYYDLYDANECVPKKKPTQKQLQALKKARYMAELVSFRCAICGQTQTNDYGDTLKVTRKMYQEQHYTTYTCFKCEDREKAITWAKNCLEYGDFLILDTETSDLDGEIIEIAIINAQGETLLNQRIKPTGKIAFDAQSIHGITLEALQDCPTFPKVYEQIKSIIKGKAVLIYNAAFDMARLASDCIRHNLPDINYGDACVMLWYAQYCGQWSDYHQSYRWQKLEGGDHTALGDCKATLDVIHKMAKGK